MSSKRKRSSEASTAVPEVTGVALAQPRLTTRSMSEGQRATVDAAGESSNDTTARRVKKRKTTSEEATTDGVVAADTGTPVRPRKKRTTERTSISSTDADDEPPFVPTKKRKRDRTVSGESLSSAAIEASAETTSTPAKRRKSVRTPTSNDTIGSAKAAKAEKSKKRLTAPSNTLTTGYKRFCWVLIQKPAEPQVAEPPSKKKRKSSSSDEDQFIEMIDGDVIEGNQVLAEFTPEYPPCVAKKEGIRIQKAIGSQFCAAETSNNLTVVHQSVAIVSAMGAAASSTVRYRTWCTEDDWVEKERYDPEMLYIVRHQSDDCYADALEFYEAIRRKLPAAKTPVPCYPVLSEVQYAAAKIGDMKALQHIASISTEHDYQYRPEICLTTDGCWFSGVRDVHKRSHTSCAEGVRLHYTEEDTFELMCQSHNQERPALPNEPIWFHQEYVDSLRTWGELRVLIANVADPNGVRGKSGHIVGVFHTKFLGEDGQTKIACLTSRTLPQHTPFAAFGGKVKLEDIERFALYVHRRLRERPDWETNFESLENGVRLDIGISADFRPFVVEITREWYGDHFCGWSEHPNCAGINALAAARFARYGVPKVKPK
ncbi:hypothetical protein LTR37_004956 [Vermiconidia calcicola]|uniref:Uncharacterized protein n=1 Tax=Vermiconidia calcicola TaxID=1690605 RepID=A0ACC3NKP6_9PEZI|nr:hypothetical protein LTR37_004956 [Vermiconidia calcicola]